METIFLCTFLFITNLKGQDTDTSIVISHFMYPEINGIPIILDEGGENSFFLDLYYPQIINDYHINYIKVDGALHLPQGSYFLPALLPKGTAPDSINNFSQIHYRTGDYNSGELGLALQIKGADSSFFSLQGFKQSPPVMYTYSSWSDNLQNYLMSYERFTQDATISVDVMYHLEDYHLPLSSLIEPEYKREAESFHGSFGIEKKWARLFMDLRPAFQITHADRQDSLTTYLTLWNDFSSKLDLGEKINLSLQHQYKMMISEKDSNLNEIEANIVRPSLQFDSGGIILEGGMVLYNGLVESEGKASWRYKNLYVAAGREFHIYFKPVHMAEYKQIEYSISTINIGYISSPLKVMVYIFQVRNSRGDLPGIREEIDMNLSWLQLSQKAGIYNINSDDSRPIAMFNHLSLLFSPNVWRWRSARFQPFMGLESYYLQSLCITCIDPTKVPLFDNSDFGSYTSHLLNMELGFLVNRFKISYRWINLLRDLVQNSSRTYPIQPIQQLAVVWQFWN